MLFSVSMRHLDRQLGEHVAQQDPDPGLAFDLLHLHGHVLLGLAALDPEGDPLPRLVAGDRLADVLGAVDGAAVGLQDLVAGPELAVGRGAGDDLGDLGPGRLDLVADLAQGDHRGRLLGPVHQGRVLGVDLGRVLLLGVQLGPRDQLDVAVGHVQQGLVEADVVVDPDRGQVELALGVVDPRALDLEAGQHVLHRDRG